MAGSGVGMEVTKHPDSKEKLAKHEIAHGINARKDPATYRKEAAEGKKISDRDKKPDEISRKKTQNDQLKEKVKGLDRAAALIEFKKKIGYDNYTVSQ